MITKGILIVDKPSGVTSHAVVNWARRCSGEKRVGHAGTLDPLASGLLIVLIGREWTKQQERFLKQDKEYLFTLELGKTTDTLDSMGKLQSQAAWSKVKEITSEHILSCLPQLTGAIVQTVPAFSAVKVKGRKLYELARAHELTADAVLPAKKITVYDFELLSFHKNELKHTSHVSLKVRCSSGTYVRALAHDLGQALEVGAHVTALRRTHIGTMSIADAQLCPIIKKLPLSE